MRRRGLPVLHQPARRPHASLDWLGGGRFDDARPATTLFCLRAGASHSTAQTLVDRSREMVERIAPRLGARWAER
eukprot:11918431-Alexandrium_andersonii.AAC.1